MLSKIELSTTACREDSSVPEPEELPTEELKIRILAAVPRSGSTLFMRIFREAPQCAVTSRLILMGNHSLTEKFAPDYSIYSNPSALKVYREAKASGKSILISKEELGHECWKGECDYAIFPDRPSASRSKPVFLFRDPLRVFDSWKAVGWNDLGSLIIAYQTLYRTWCMLKSYAIAIACEELIGRPRQIVERLCRHWGVEFSDDLLVFQHPFGEYLFSSEREQRIYKTENPLGLFSTVQSNHTVNADIKSHNLLTMTEKDRIENALGPLYMDTYEERLDTVRAALKSKTHFGFDLDDTLHEFRKASTTASEAVFAYLAEHDGTTSEELKITYSDILAKATYGAFTEGKSSDDYRRERFSALMKAHEIEATEEKMQHLLQIYKTSLQASLTLKSGAIELLSKLREQGKKIILVTEGPEDAQQWTIEKLGIADKVDMLVTSNKVGKTKTNGLFGEVLRKLAIEAKDFVFIGDNKDRDIVPAEKEGILTVHYDESSNIQLEMEQMRVNSLWKLAFLMEDGVTTVEEFNA
ncbi:MAG: hypothetical protein Q9219_007335 [cf. Caloplaca sp. 3 TL-2023]